MPSNLPLWIIIIGALVAIGVGKMTFGGLGCNPFNAAYTSTDGIDYIPMPTWKVFLIQFLNIAGLGPIFGAIMGILYGPSAYLWIVFGTIFGGAVHDYLSGMLSVRRNGASLPELVGDELGSGGFGNGMWNNPFMYLVWMWQLIWVIARSLTTDSGRIFGEM